MKSTNDEILRILFNPFNPHITAIILEYENPMSNIDPALNEAWLATQKALSSGNDDIILQNLLQVESNCYSQLMRKFADTYPDSANDFIHLFYNLAKLTTLIGSYSERAYLHGVSDIINCNSVLSGDNPYCPEYGIGEKIHGIIQQYLLPASPLKYYIDAAMIYQYYSSMQQDNQIDQELLQLKQQMLQFVNSDVAMANNVQQKTILHKEILSDLRTSVQSSVELISTHSSSQGQ